MVGLKTKKLDKVDYLLATILFGIGFLMIYPLWWVLMTSLSDPVWLSTNTVRLFPQKFSAIAYKFILGESKLWQSYWNSTIYAVGSMVVTLLTCALFAYPLSLPFFRGKTLFNTLLIIPMFFTGGMIPAYMQIMRLGLLDTTWSMILPSAISAYYVILIRTQMKSIPLELRESALIDGAGEFRIFFQIVIPLSTVIFLIIALYAIVASWNSFTPPLLYLSDSTKQPLSIYLRSLIITSTTDTSELTWGGGSAAYYQSIASQGGGIGMRTAIKMGTVVVTVLPIMLIYPFIQKHFVKGVMLGSVKG